MKNVRTLRLRAFASALLLASLPALAQDNGPVLHKAEVSNAPLSTKVKEVSFYAVVRDKKGGVVDTLASKDFVLEQDTHAQSIAALVPKTDAPLVFGVLADTGSGQRKAMADERKAATDFVKQLREDKDKAFVLHFDSQVELLQDVTGDHDKLARGIDAISIGDQAPSSSGRHRDEPDSDRPHYFFGGSTLYDAIYLTAGEVLKGVPGRKTVVLFSDGTDSNSKTSLKAAIEAAQRADAMIYCVYVPSEREESQQNRAGRGGRGGGFPGGGGYPGGGGGYPGGGGGYPGGGGGYPGVGGGRGQTPSQENRGEGKKVLEQIAHETGGRMFELSKKVTVSDVYNMIGEELHHQYSLTYKPDQVEVGYHRLHLTTRNGELSVQTRDGFYAD